MEMSSGCWPAAGRLPRGTSFRPAREASFRPAREASSRPARGASFRPARGAAARPDPAPPRAPRAASPRPPRGASPRPARARHRPPPRPSGRRPDRLPRRVTATALRRVTAASSGRVVPPGPRGVVPAGRGVSSRLARGVSPSALVRQRFTPGSWRPRPPAGRVPDPRGCLLAGLPAVAGRPARDGGLRPRPPRCSPGTFVLQHTCENHYTIKGRTCVKGRAPVWRRPSTKDVRRRPTLPRGPPRSTIGAEGLNFRVRNGTGCFPFAITTETLWRCQPVRDRCQSCAHPSGARGPDRISGTA